MKIGPLIYKTYTYVIQITDEDGASRLCAPLYIFWSAIPAINR